VTTRWCEAPALGGSDGGCDAARVVSRPGRGGRRVVAEQVELAVGVRVVVGELELGEHLVDASGSPASSVSRASHGASSRVVVGQPVATS
jgi:hypothetical protein